jgi:plasmid maintenance system antidote protein VapI
MANVKLQTYLKDNFVNMAALARSMGVTRQSLQAKVSGKTNFTQSDLLLIKETLHLSDEQFVSIFFTREGEKVSTTGGGA